MKSTTTRFSAQLVRQLFITAANTAANGRVRCSKEAKNAMLAELEAYAKYLGLVSYAIINDTTKNRTITGKSIQLAAQYFKGFAKGVTSSIPKLADSTASQ